MMNTGYENTMNPPHVSLKFLSLLVLMIAASLLWITLQENYSTKEMHHMMDADFKSVELRGKILRLEESTTMALRMAILHGDKKWEQKYQIYRPVLDGAIQALMSQSYPTIQDKNEVLDLRDSKIDSMQKQAYEAFKKNDLVTAKQILFSPAYSLERERYNELLRQYDTLLRTEAENHFNNTRTSAHYIYFSIFLAFLLSLTAWIFYYRSLLRYKRIAVNEQQLEELLYYQQVNQIQTHTAEGKSIPTEIFSLQKNRKIFFTELEESLKNNRFILHYQPIIRIEDEQLLEAEALLRWQHPQHGLLTPATFISLFH